MTDTSQEASPPPEHLPGRSVQDRGSTVSMTSTTTGLPDRYRPIDQVGPDEPTPTGVIQCWRAKDRVLNRDVAIRVHTPAGPAAHAWISRALTAAKWTVQSAQLAWKAKNPVKVEAAHRGDVEAFLSELDEDDDVQNIFVGLDA